MFVINKTLQHITDYENNNKYRQEKSARRKCRGKFNHKLLSENIIYDPLTVFSKPTGAISVKIIR